MSYALMTLFSKKTTENITYLNDSKPKRRPERSPKRSTERTLPFTCEAYILPRITHISISTIFPYLYI